MDSPFQLTDAAVKKPGTDDPIDPNLQQMQQRAAATPPADGTPLPPPPPLPTATTTPAPGSANINVAPSNPGTGLMIPPPPQLPTAPPATAPAAPTGSALDAWWKEHGNGARYSTANGSTVDAAAMTYGALRQAKPGVGGMTEDILASYGLDAPGLAGDFDAATREGEARFEYGKTHGGFEPGRNPNANPISLSGSAALPTAAPPPPALGAGGGITAPGAAPTMNTTQTTNSPRIPLAPPPTARDAGTPSSGVGSSVAKMPTGAPGQYTAADVGIGSTVLPNADPRLAGTQGMVDTAAKGLANVDRVKLGEDIFNQFAEATDPQYKLGIRRATQAAAGAGRIGSGMLRTEYGTLAGDRARELDLAKRGFMSDALNGSIADSFNKFAALSGLEGQQFGEGVQTRGELRGERGYQGSLEQQAFERALLQWQLQQGAQQQQFNNGVTSTQVGGSGNPADYYTDLAKQYGLDPALIAALAGSFGSGRTGTPPIIAPQTRGKLPSGGTPPQLPPPVSDPLYPPGQLPA